jgi:hypothetical protein
VDLRRISSFEGIHQKLSGSLFTASGLTQIGEKLLNSDNTSAIPGSGI